jgi:hypothetical protein
MAGERAAGGNRSSTEIGLASDCDHRSPDVRNRGIKRVKLELVRFVQVVLIKHYGPFECL